MLLGEMIALKSANDFLFLPFRNRMKIGILTFEFCLLEIVGGGGGI